MNETTPKQHRIGVVQMILTAVLWSIAGIFIKQIPWNAVAITGWRGLVAALVALGYMLVRRTKFRFTAKSFFAGFFQAAMSFCFVMATKLTTAANAIVLQYVSPVFLLGLSVLLFRKKLYFRDAAVTAATVLGVALAFLGELSADGMAGNCIALGAGVFTAGMYLTASRCEDDERMSGVLIGHLLTAVVGVTYSFFTVTEVTFQAAAFVAILGVFQLGLPFVLYALAQKHCSALECNLLGTVEPLLNPVWVFLFDGEAPSILALAGMVVVMGSVTLWTVAKAKKPLPNQA